jgi:hypothetical protein
MLGRCFLAAGAFVLALLLAGPLPGADATSSGVITGIVTNKTTGNGLIGAKVELPAIHATAFVDQTGRYVLNAPWGGLKSASFAGKM